MANVYAASSLTIAAADGADSHAGLFSRRWVGRHDIFFRSTGGTFSIPGQRLDLAVRKLPGDFPLDQSGWVFQERLMSPRTVYFSNGLTHWECRHGSTGEYISASDVPDFNSNLFRRYTIPQFAAQEEKHALSKRLFASIQSGDRVFQENSRLYLGWWTIVSQYSKLGLFYQKDKLVAIAGIASMIEARITNSSSSFGIWHRFLPDELLWTRHRKSRHDLEGGSNYSFAPSWSWASKYNTYIDRIEHFEGVPQSYSFSSYYPGGSLSNKVAKA